MKNKKYDRQGLLDMLRAGFTQVTFTKVDGSKRFMECTLRKDLIPADKMPKSKDEDEDGSKTRKENLDTIRVFDTEKSEWRSFRIDSVQYAHTLE